MFKFDADASLRMVMGLVFLLIGLAVIRYAIHEAPPLSSFLGGKSSADGRDASTCIYLLLVGTGACAVGLSVLPVEEGAGVRLVAADFMFPVVLACAGLTLIASTDGVIRRWPIAFGGYKYLVGGGLILASVGLVIGRRRR